VNWPRQRQDREDPSLIDKADDLFFGVTAIFHVRHSPM
jgi:hypothetical protein